MKFKPATFDGIIASYSIIHLPKKDVPKTIKNFHEILKKGGAIYFSVQEGESRELISESPLKPGQKMFLNIVSAKELREIISETGFKILNEFTRPPKNQELDFNKLVIIAKKN